MRRMSRTRRPLYIGLLKDTPLGNVWLAVTEQGLAAVHSAKTRQGFESYLISRFDSPLLEDQAKTARAAREIKEYLDGKRRVFQLNGICRKTSNGKRRFLV